MTPQFERAVALDKYLAGPGDMSAVIREEKTFQEEA